MAFDGAGAYSAPSSSFNPAVDATDIEPTDWNSLLADLVTALSTTVCKDGQTTTTARIPFASGISTDTITEKTAATGVTIDGVLLKDNKVATSYVKGTATNDSASAGDLGEVATGQSGGSVALTTATAKTITSVSLTAGNWILYGTVVYNGQTATVPTDAIAGFSTTTDTLPSSSSSADNTNRQDLMVPARAMNGSFMTNTIGPYRVSLAATTTYYLIGYAGFGSGTMEAYGTIKAIRPR